MLTEHSAPDSVHQYYALARSPHWRHFRDQIIKARGKCELSGVATDLEAHHIIPFHFGVLLGRNYIELDERNILVISGGPVNLHLLLGHCNSFQSFNLQVRHAAKWAAMREEDIKDDHDWQMLAMHRPKAWHEMTAHDKTALMRLIDINLPIARQGRQDAILQP